MLVSHEYSSCTADCSGRHTYHLYIIRREDIVKEKQQLTAKTIRHTNRVSILPISAVSSTTTCLMAFSSISNFESILSNFERILSNLESILSNLEFIIKLKGADFRGEFGIKVADCSSEAAFEINLKVAYSDIHRLFEMIQLYFYCSYICLKHADLVDNPALRRGMTRVVRRILRRRRHVTIMM